MDISATSLYTLEQMLDSTKNSSPVSNDPNHHDNANNLNEPNNTYNEFTSVPTNHGHTKHPYEEYLDNTKNLNHHNNSKNIQRYTQGQGSQSMHQSFAPPTHDNPNNPNKPIHPNKPILQASIPNTAPTPSVDDIAPMLIARLFT